jgi:hypothetical protein
VHQDDGAMTREDDVGAAGEPADVETKAQAVAVERTRRSGVVSWPRIADMMRERVGEGTSIRNPNATRARNKVRSITYRDPYAKWPARFSDVTYSCRNRRFHK